jgi:formate/nitrite transporter FocA (FNT family)
MAARVAITGIGKARQPALSRLILAVLGGVFIAFGAMFYTLAI